MKVRVRYRRQMLDVEADHDMLRISSRSFTANPITIAYRGRFRDVAPGDVSGIDQAVEGGIELIGDRLEFGGDRLEVGDRRGLPVELAGPSSSAMRQADAQHE